MGSGSLHGAYAIATSTIPLFMCIRSFSSVFFHTYKCLMYSKLLCQFGAWVAFYGFQALVKMFIAKSLTTSACEQQNAIIETLLPKCSKNRKLMCIITKTKFNAGSYAVYRFANNHISVDQVQ